MADNRAASYVSSVTLWFVVGLYLVWIAAWSLERRLEVNLPWMRTAAGQTAYWTLMKVVLWVLPAIGLIRWSGRTVQSVLVLHRVKSILLWGGGVGALLVALALAQKAANHRLFFPGKSDWSFFAGVFIAPVVEELTFRGAILGNLLQRYSFATANTLTAGLFLGAHLPGWYFQGRLSLMLTAPLGGALSVFLLGWLFGFVAYKGKSTAASTLTHILSNFAAS